MQRTLFILSPVFKDAESFSTIRQTLRQTAASEPALKNFKLQFMAVNDLGFEDPELTSMASDEDTFVLDAPFNMGHQHAIVFGLRKLIDQVGPDDIVVTMDSDGQDKPGDVSALVSPLLNASETAALSLAFRTKRSETFGFRMMYAAYKAGFYFLTGKVMKSGNFAAIPGSVLARVLSHPFFNLCYSSTLINLGLPIHYVGCERGKRIAGESRMNFLKLVTHGLRMLIPFMDGIAVRLLTIFGSILAAGSLGLAGLSVSKWLYQAAVPSWAFKSLAGIVLFSVGFLINFIILFTLYSQLQGAYFPNLVKFETPRKPSH